MLGRIAKTVSLVGVSGGGGGEIETAVGALPVRGVGDVTRVVGRRSELLWWNSLSKRGLLGWIDGSRSVGTDFT